MKKYLHGTLILLSAVWSLTVHANTDEHLVLSLETVVGGDVSSTVELYGSNIDPNLSDTEDTYTLYINGEDSELPQLPVLENLAQGRRTFSYDSLSGGVESQEIKTGCMMAGLAAGVRLKVRYLEYENMKVVSHSMKTVLSLPINCLYTEDVHPVNQAAKLEAMRTVGKLEALGLIF